ncbi:hypothetical protein EV363DRAFT_1416827 [Boletus edulis]|nr:hypothetical protein EV363DRAFT_1416827 [Boletus edulis]
MSTCAQSSTAYPPQDAEAQEFIGFRRELSVAQRQPPWKCHATAFTVQAFLFYPQQRDFVVDNIQFQSTLHFLRMQTKSSKALNLITPFCVRSCKSVVSVFPNLNASPAPIVVNDRTSTSHPAYVLGPYGTYHDTQTAFNSFLTPRHNSPGPDRHMLSHLIEQDICNQLLDQSSAYSFLSHAASSRYPGQAHRAARTLNAQPHGVLAPASMNAGNTPHASSLVTKRSASAVHQFHIQRPQPIWAYEGGVTDACEQDTTTSGCGWHGRRVRVADSGELDRSILERLGQAVAS